MPVDDELHGLYGNYIASPQWVKSLVGGAYSMVPASIRHGNAYGRFLAVFADPEVRKAHVHARLGETLFAALSGTSALSAYRSLADEAIRSPEQVLAELPLTTKEDIKSGLDRYLNTSVPASARLKMVTGGSTSIPMTFFVHKGVSRAKEWAAFHAMGMRFGTEGEDVILSLRGRTVPTAMRGRIWMYEPIKRHLILSSDHLEPSYMPQYVEALRHWRPRYIHAFPSALYPLLVWLRDHGQQGLLSQVSCVVLTSESVFEEQLGAFRAFFDCPVIVTYGHTERVLLANTLPGDGRYHFWPHYGQLELVDHEGRPVTEPGRPGEIVGTSFDNLVMPFVRYRTGDFAVMGGASHESAAGFPVLERIDGRLQEFVVCRDHRLVTVTTLGAAHFQQLDRCLRMQYEQREAGELILRVVAIGTLDESARRSIAGAVSDKTQGGCRVHVEQVDRIDLTPIGKQRLLVQHMPMQRYLGAAMSVMTMGAAGAFGTVARAGRAALAPDAPLAPAESVAARLGRRRLLVLGTDQRTRGGIAAVIGTYRAGGLFDRLPMLHIATHEDGARLRKALRFAHALHQLLMELMLGRVALVHAHASSRASFWRKSCMLAIARAFRVPTVFHLHSGGFREWIAADRVGLRRWWIRRTLERSDRVIVLTRTWAEWMRGFAPLARVSVLGNPVVLPATPVDESLRGSCQGAGRVLFLGWIYDFKGVYDLLQAWVLFRKACPGWRLVMGGKGEVDRLLAEADRLGVRGDLDFLGWVAGEDKDRELRRADILVLPSYAEGMPVSVLEAMAYGVAVATTPVGGVPDIMEPNVDGLWMTPGDIQSICDRLVQLAQSPELRLRLADAAARRVRRDSSVGAVLERLQAIYAEVVP